MIRSLLISLSLTSSLSAFADFPFGSNEFEGKVRAVAFDREVRVKVVSLDSQESKVVKICEGSSPAGQARAQRKIEILRAALENQDTVKMDVSDLFDTCLGEIEVVSVRAATSTGGRGGFIRPASATN